MSGGWQTVEAWLAEHWLLLALFLLAAAAALILTALVFRFLGWLWSLTARLPRARIALDRFRRNYLWVLIPLALIGYAALWFLLTWKIPLIAREALDLLETAAAGGAG